MHQELQSYNLFCFEGLPDFFFQDSDIQNSY